MKLLVHIIGPEMHEFPFEVNLLLGDAPAGSPWLERQRAFYREITSAVAWVEENCAKGDWRYDDMKNSFFFKKETDVFAFKIRWG